MGGGRNVRTDLTAAEWKKVQALAKRERVSASQLVGRFVRAGLLNGGGIAAPSPSSSRSIGRPSGSVANVEGTR